MGVGLLAQACDLTCALCIYWLILSFLWCYCSYGHENLTLYSQRVVWDAHEVLKVLVMVEWFYRVIFERHIFSESIKHDELWPLIANFWLIFFLILKAQMKDNFISFKMNKVYTMDMWAFKVLMDTRMKKIPKKNFFPKVAPTTIELSWNCHIYKVGFSQYVLYKTAF